MKENIEAYLEYKYPIEIVECGEGGYFARVPDLPGCMTQGETIEELMEMIEDAKRAWILTALEDGKEIPKPRELTEEYSGRFVVRMSRTLHRQLVENAKKEGVSLNQYVVQLLAQAVGAQQQMTQMQQMIVQTISAITQPSV